MRGPRQFRGSRRKRRLGRSMRKPDSASTLPPERGFGDDNVRGDFAQLEGRKLLAVERLYCGNHAWRAEGLFSHPYVNPYGPSAVGDIADFADWSLSTNFHEHPGLWWPDWLEIRDGDKDGSRIERRWHLWQSSNRWLSIL